MSACTFTDRGVRSGLRQKRALGEFILRMVKSYTRREAVLSYVFVDDETLLDMNRQYLQHDTYTDIISFDLSEASSPVLIGDIYISIDRVRENAESMGIRLSDERLRVILHGALHLSGFGDKTAKQQAEMRQLEEKWMKKFLSRSAH